MPFQRSHFFSHKQKLKQDDQAQSNVSHPILASHLHTGNIAGQLCKLAQQKIGSSFIMSQLNEAPEHRKIAFFDEMFPNLKTLVTNRFANLVVQKFFAVANENLRRKLISQIQLNFFEFSCSEYGSFVVRKAIERATNVQLICFMKQCTEQNVVSMAKDPYGHFVIEQLIRTANRQCQVNF